MPESLGRLRRVRRIGAGGFASVWLYRDEQLDSYVAVKALADNWAQQIDVRERFLEEARVLRRAASDHVVEVHDFGETDDGTPYFVMTYADRGTVADLLREGPASVATTVELIEQACRGVADLHAVGVVHRDVKPPNLLLRSDQRRGQRLLVADLGLAKALMYASGLTQIVGTPAYMAPEQGIPGGGVDERTDVHALGAVAYHLLSGRPMRDVAISDVGSAPAPPPLHQVADVPPALDDAVLRAVQPSPADRWPSPLAFSAAMRAAVGDQPPTQYVPGVMPVAARRTPTDTRIETAAATAVGPAPAPARSRRRTIGALVAAVVVVLAAAVGLLALRDDDPTDEATGSRSPGASTTPSQDGTPTTDQTGTPTDVKPVDRPYCSEVVNAWATLDGIDLDGDDWAEQFQTAIDTIHAVAQTARTPVADEWRLVDRPFQELQAAVADAGVTFEDLQQGNIVQGSPQARQLRTALDEFQRGVEGFQGNERIGATIATDAQVRCGVDLTTLTSP